MISAVHRINSAKARIQTGPGPARLTWLPRLEGHVCVDVVCSEGLAVHALVDGDRVHLGGQEVDIGVGGLGQSGVHAGVERGVQNRRVQDVLAVPMRAPRVRAVQKRTTTDAADVRDLPGEVRAGALDSHQGFAIADKELVDPSERRPILRKVLQTVIKFCYSTPRESLRRRNKMHAPQTYLECRPRCRDC